MKNLDQSQPYGTVYGIPGIAYQQSGRYYGHDRRMIGDDSDGPAKIDEPAPDQKLKGAKANLLASSALNVSKGEDPDDETLKRQLEIFGVEWKGRDAALKFIKGHDAG